MWNELRRGKGSGLLVFACVAGAAFLTGCKDSEQANAAPPAEVPDTSIKILAAAEAREFEITLVRAAATAGLAMEVDYAGPDELAERAAKGGWDAVLTTNAAHTEVLLGQRIKRKTQLGSTNVAVGVKLSKAKSLGWDKATPNWQQIGATIESGRFTYAMGAPSWSSTGMAAVMSAELVGGGSGAAASGLMGGAKLVSPSDAWLAEQFLRERAVMDGVVASEALIMSINRRSQGFGDKLMLVYPSQAPLGMQMSLLMLGKPNAFGRMSEALLSPRIQMELVSQFNVRPGLAGVQRATDAPDVSVSMMDGSSMAPIAAFVQEKRAVKERPARTTVLVVPANIAANEKDESGAKKGLMSLLDGSDTSVTALGSGVLPGDRVVLIGYGSSPMEASVIRVTQANAAEVKAEMRKAVEKLAFTYDGVALFDAVLQGQALAEEAAKAEGAGKVSVVVVAGEENSTGQGTYAYQKSTRGSHRTQVVMFGKAQELEADAIARSTGGRVLKAKAGEVGRAMIEALEYR